MTAAWHVGPIEGAEFWWTLVSSPEILVFLFFMITDPRTIPASRAGRRAYAVGVGLLATLLIAPFTTEFATKVAVLERALPRLRSAAAPRRCSARHVSLLDERFAPLAGSPLRASLAGALVFAGLVIAAGIPARPGAAAATGAPQALPDVTVLDSRGVAEIDESTARNIARDVVADLRHRVRGSANAEIWSARPTGASGEWLAALWQRIREASDGADRRLRRTTSRGWSSASVPGDDQGPPTVVARLEGTRTPSRTVELALEGGRYRIVRSEGGLPALDRGRALARKHVERHLARGRRTGGRPATSVNGAFRFGISNDTTAMMGGGLCWLDYDSDGWLDLFVVNSYALADMTAWEARGGLPRSALYRNEQGKFTDVSARHRRRSPTTRERMRRCRLRPRRPHRHLRDDCGIQRADRRVRRTSLERRRRVVHGGRSSGRHQLARMARRGGGRRRERRRAAGPVRVELHRRELADPLFRFRLPHEPPCGARPPLPQSRRTARTTAPRSARWGRSPASRTSGSVTASARCSPTSIATGASTYTWRTTGIRTSCTGTSRGPESSGSGSPRSLGVRPSTTRTPAWASQPPTSARTGAPTCS